MTICDLTQFYAAGSGGIKTYLDAKREQLNRYPEIRHVLIVPGERHEVHHHGRHITYYVRGSRIPISPAYRFTFNAAAVRTILKEEKPQVVELGCPYFFPWVVFASVPRRDTAIVGFYHTHFPAAYARITAERLWPRAGNLAESTAARYAAAVYNRCDLTFTTSSQIAEELSGYGVNNVAAARFGVDLEVFHPSKRSLPHRLALGLREQDILLVYAGRFDKEKRIEILLKAFSYLSQDHRYHLLMIGQGPQQSIVDEAAARHPRVHKKKYFFSKAELTHWLASADIYATAGLWETFGFSVAEAQACGLPVIGVKQGALMERINAATGALAQPDNPKDFSECIRQVASQRREMSEVARRHAEMHYDWRSAIDLLLSYYENTLKQKLQHLDNFENGLTACFARSH